MVKVDQIVQDLESVGWSFLPNLLSSGQLHQFSLLFEQQFHPARVGKKTGLIRDESIRGDWTAWVDPVNPPPELEPIMQFINELKAAMNQGLFLGLKDFECHLAKYPVGTFYKKHIDRHTSESSRVLSFIFYLHQEWNQSDGGELALYEQDNLLTEITPMPGSFICFLSDKFPHEVKLTQRERRSLTGWIHNKNLN